MNCKTCKFYEPASSHSTWLGFGHCARWHADYHLKKEEMANNEALVECDEGWGNIVGPEFGCVLHMRKKND